MKLFFILKKFLYLEEILNFRKPSSKKKSDFKEKLSSQKFFLLKKNILNMRRILYSEQGRLHGIRYVLARTDSALLHGLNLCVTDGRMDGRMDTPSDHIEMQQRI